MSRYRLGTEIRFLIALMVGVATGLFANSMVHNGAFFVGGTALGTMVALWLFHLGESALGSRSSESHRKDNPPQ